MSRERLFALFWPESDSERARNTLNQMVFAIRRDLAPDAVLTDGTTVSLNPAVVDSDSRRFRDAIVGKRFTDAIEIYRGPFLDGVFLRDTPDFERWDRRSAAEFCRGLWQRVGAKQSTWR
jgi:DNA-binding SARP family transcriptional activator